MALQRPAGRAGPGGRERATVAIGGFPNRNQVSASIDSLGLLHRACTPTCDLERQQGLRYVWSVGTNRSTAEPSRQAEAGTSADASGRSIDVDTRGLTADERSQIAARLRLSPSDRLRYLEDMIAFESLARSARRVT